MKTRYWVILLSVLVAVCLLLCTVLYAPGERAAEVRVISEGKVLHTLPLSEDTQMEIVSSHGSNVITVKNGKVAVTEADCPDHYCMDRGFCDRGTQIVCLPNRLVLEFTGKQSVDGISG